MGPRPSRHTHSVSDSGHSARDLKGRASPVSSHPSRGQLLQPRPSTMSRPSRWPSRARQSPLDDRHPPTTIGQPLAWRAARTRPTGSRLRRQNTSSEDAAGSRLAQTRSPARLTMTVGRPRTVRISRTKHRACSVPGAGTADPTTTIDCARTMVPRVRPTSPGSASVPVPDKVGYRRRSRGSRWRGQAATPKDVSNMRGTATLCGGRNRIGWWCLGRPNVRRRDLPGVRHG